MSATLPPAPRSARTLQEKCTLREKRCLQQLTIDLHHSPVKAQHVRSTTVHRKPSDGVREKQVHRILEPVREGRIQVLVDRVPGHYRPTIGRSLSPRVVCSARRVGRDPPQLHGVAEDVRVDRHVWVPHVKQVDDGRRLLADALKPLKLCMDTLLGLLAQILQRRLSVLFVHGAENVLDPLRLLWGQTSALDRRLHCRRLRSPDDIPRAKCLLQLLEGPVRVGVGGVLRQDGANNGVQDLPPWPRIRLWVPGPEVLGEDSVQADDIFLRGA
mmetsp:Transcript_92827/g.207874  ORF Transcript_92827/g.207874 Transcript_92827/m.207874 type:complete len:271 (-) Transcript_92827:94-906(-)